LPPGTASFLINPIQIDTALRFTGTLTTAATAEAAVPSADTATGGANEVLAICTKADGPDFINPLNTVMIQNLINGAAILYNFINRPISEFSTELYQQTHTNNKYNIIWFAGCNLSFSLFNNLSNIRIIAIISKLYNILKQDGYIIFTESNSYIEHVNTAISGRTPKANTLSIQEMHRYPGGLTVSNELAHAQVFFSEWDRYFEFITTEDYYMYRKRAVIATSSAGGGGSLAATAPPAPPPSNSDVRGGTGAPAAAAAAAAAAVPPPSSSAPAAASAGGGAAGGGARSPPVAVPFYYKTVDATGDCLYFSLYYALHERPVLFARAKQLFNLNLDNPDNPVSPAEFNEQVRFFTISNRSYLDTLEQFYHYIETIKYNTDGSNKDPATILFNIMAGTTRAQRTMLGLRSNEILSTVPGLRKHTLLDNTDNMIYTYTTKQNDADEIPTLTGVGPGQITNITNRETFINNYTAFFIAKNEDNTGAFASQLEFEFIQEFLLQNSIQIITIYTTTLTPQLLNENGNDNIFLYNDGTNHWDYFSISAPVASAAGGSGSISRPSGSARPRPPPPTGGASGGAGGPRPPPPASGGGGSGGGSSGSARSPTAATLKFIDEERKGLGFILTKSDGTTLQINKSMYITFIRNGERITAISQIYTGNGYPQITFKTEIHSGITGRMHSINLIAPEEYDSITPIPYPITLVSESPKTIRLNNHEYVVGDYISLDANTVTGQISTIGNEFYIISIRYKQIRNGRLSEHEVTLQPAKYASVVPVRIAGGPRPPPPRRRTRKHARHH
jgi:hypothetical protein